MENKTCNWHFSIISSLQKIIPKFLKPLFQVELLMQENRLCRKHWKCLVRQTLVQATAKRL